MAICISFAEGNRSWQNGPEKFKISSIKKIVWLLHAVTDRSTNHFLPAFFLSLLFSVFPHPFLSLLDVIISQVPCRLRTARRQTRGSTSAWRLMWKACATRPLLTFMCEVGSNPAPEPGQKIKTPTHSNSNVCTVQLSFKWHYCWA